MIFSLHFSLIMAGYSACGILLGSYMIRYAGASELDLGFLFMIPPLTVFTRPFICARADRYQSHKQLLTLCCCGNFLAYIPFIVLPFLLEWPQLEALLTIRLRFWLLTLCHVLGCLSFCGIRSLGDALAVNYAKRVGSDFTSYRKFGAISFGCCGFALGLINQNWLLPDFVPSFIMNVCAIFVLMILFYLWPDEYFVMRADKPPPLRSSSSGERRRPQSLGGQKQGDKLCQLARYEHNQLELPVGRELRRRLLAKLARTVFFWRRAPSDSERESESDSNANDDSRIINSECVYSQQARKVSTHLRPADAKFPGSGSSSSSSKGGQQLDSSSSSGGGKPLTMSQQMQIFWLLVKRDIRIPLFLALLLYGGLVGYAPPNFAFTYMNEFCHERATCDAASLSGLVMISYCVCETTCYVIINALKRRYNLSYVWLLELTLVSLALHYFSYGFLLPYYLSPYIFLVESLHGLEYSASLASGVELAYRFANEVDLLIPELIERGIISPSDNQELVRLSLMATMNGCFTFIYDGFGTIIGSFVYGLTIDTYSFTFTWRLIGALAAAGAAVLPLVVLLGKYLDIRPQILRSPAKLAEDLTAEAEAEARHRERNLV